MDSTSAALLIGDLAGVAVFAASGGSAAVAKRLDIFGVIFVGFAASLGGGIFRDLVLNSGPVAFTDWRYGVTAIVASSAVFWLHAGFERSRRIVLLLDAAGLALFTVTGTLKALDFGTPAFGACLLGMITGIGGGVLRDIVTGEIPLVLRREIYAVASLLGAVAVTALHWAHMRTALTMIGCGLLVFVVRLTALYRRWSAPRPRLSGASAGGPDR